MPNLYHDDVYTVRRKILTVLGAKFHVYDAEGALIFFSRMKAFKLREDIRLYASEAMEKELLALHARQIIDFGAMFDVFDPVANEIVGSLRRKGFKSILRDEWLIFDPDGREIGVIREDSGGLAILRRMHDGFALLAPQAFHVMVGDRTVATFQQNRNPFVMKITADFTADREQTLDRRLGLAAAILLTAIEGKQR